MGSLAMAGAEAGSVVVVLVADMAEAGEASVVVVSEEEVGTSAAVALVHRT
ncbi:MAG: hypothetical protein WA183_15675 [Chthoniobacterales bacterium]